MLKCYGIQMNYCWHKYLEKISNLEYMVKIIETHKIIRSGFQWINKLSTLEDIFI